MASIRSLLLTLVCLIGQSTLLHANDSKIKPTIASKAIAGKHITQEQKFEEKVLETKDVKISSKKDTPIKLSKADKRKRKRNKPKKLTMREMNFDELKEMKDQRIQEDDIEAAIKYAEKLIPMCKDMHELKDLTLELANLLFKKGDRDKAGKLYAEFVKLYPGSDEVVDANYQAIICSFGGMLDATRDQTFTKDTLELTHKFLERADVFDKHVDEVVVIQRQCYERLLESEVAVIDFYFKKGSFKAVENRLNGIRKDFLNKLEAAEPRVITMEIELAFKQNKIDLATQKLALLNEKFPHVSYENNANIVVAQNSKRTMMNRF